MRALVVIAIFCCYSFNLKSQGIFSVSPTNLTVGDTMTAIIWTPFPFNVGGPPLFCGHLDRWSDSSVASIIDLDVWFDITGVKFAASCSRADTFQIVLPSVPGNYIFYCHWRAIDTMNPNINGQRYFRDSLSISVNTVSRIEELSHRPFKLYPNPASDQLTIDADANLINRISLIDLNGKLLFEERGVNQIDLRGYPRGVYFLKLQFSNGSVFSEKLIIK